VPPLDLSVIVAATDASRSIDRCLQHLERSCDGIAAEVLVMDASRDDTASRVAARGGSVRLFQFRPGTLTPELWAEGYRRSSGRIVAFTTGHCLVSPDWARSLVRALDGGAAAAGGPLVLGPETRPLDWAVFALRYSAFIPERLGSGRIRGELAGDNAAYRRDAIDRHAASFASGFWEIDVHRRLRADGGWLEAVPAAVVEFGRSFPLRTIVGHRFAHGTHSGATRVQSGARTPWQIVLASPLVPFVLAGRAARRLVPVARGRSRFVVALPWFLVLAAAWAAGEAWGAMSRARRS
jgi:hypothetical protein